MVLLLVLCFAFRFAEPSDVCLGVRLCVFSTRTNIAACTDISWHLGADISQSDNSELPTLSWGQPQNL